MVLFLQLKLLLWKNIVLRRRQKLRCAVELIWPLCLFLLLMWVRSKGFHEEKHECHFEDKPLPSAGTFLYYQGLLCSFNNTCHKYPSQAYRNYTRKNSSRFFELLGDLDSFEKESLSWNRNIFESFADDLRNLANGIKTLREKKNNKPINKNKTLETKVSIDSSFATNSNQKNVIVHQRQLEKKLVNIERVIAILKLLESIDQDYDTIIEILKNTPLIDDMFLKLYIFMCGSQSGPITLSTLLKDKKRSYEAWLTNLGSVTAPSVFEYDPEASLFCNEIYEKLEKSNSLQGLWRVIKPFAKGKITFSPNTTVVKKIMDRVKNVMVIPPYQKFNLDRYALKMDSTLFNEAEGNLKFLKEFFVKDLEEEEGDAFLHLFQTAHLGTVHKADTLLKMLHKVYKKYEKIKRETFHHKEESVSEILKCYSSVKFEGFRTEREAEIRSFSLCDTNDLLAQISFMDSVNETLEPLTTYKIRMNLDRFPHPSYIGSFTEKTGPNNNPYEDLQIITYGFIYVQDIVEQSIIYELTGRNNSPGIVLKQFPYPCYVQDSFMYSLADMFPLFMVLSWVYTSSMIIRSIVHEKELKLKEMMYVLGLNNGIHWCSWFLDSLIPMSITVCLLSLILVEGKILANADLSLVMAFLMVYALATISQSFLISVFFSKANVAASCGGIIFFTTYLPFPFLEYWQTYFSWEWKIVTSLFANVALGIGSKYFAMRELEGTGTTWDNWQESPIKGDNYSLAIAMALLLFDSVLYFVLTWYVEAVFPGNIGVPKKWYFLFRKDYWFPKYKLPDIKMAKVSETTYDNEPEPTNLRRGVEIKKLTKIYKNGNIAVSNLCINFYENQITAFLGRNGAGKTTTISILCGLFPPTKGSATIYDLDIRRDMNLIRRSLGVCPQYNVLFRDFTVEEHLWFFARLKGHSPGDVQVEIQQILSDLNLLDKRNSLTTHLSGGMKRKLCIAIAFIGGSRTVILDEPTAGVDPYSRMGIWDLLLKYKKGRTIIMTTHIMSEAELLGDRIAIFANGKLLCYGSGVFLKSRFGWGCILTVDYNGGESEIHDKDYKNKKASGITEGIKRIIPSAVEIEKFGTEIKYSLPKIKGNIEIYQELFEYLDKNKDQLAIRSFGISDTTLEEIFLKKVDEEDNIGPKLECIKQFEGDDSSVSNLPIHQAQERRSFYGQFIALHVKRLNHAKRSKLALSLELLLPILFICICMWITYSLPPLEHPGSFLVDHTQCPECTSFFNVRPESTFWTHKYVNEFTNPSGLGTKCVKHQGKRYKNSNCIRTKIIPKEKSEFHTCACKNGNLDCSLSGHFEIPEKIITASGVEFLNVTGKKPSEWLLSTWPYYENLRLGGYTFGIILPLKNTDMWNFSSNNQHQQLMLRDEENPAIENASLNDNIKVWFNNKWPMSPVVYLNGINNVILRASLPRNVSEYYGIRLYVHPMNYTTRQYEYEYRFKAASALLHSVALMFSLSFVPASFVMYLIEERITNSKHLQFLSGVNWILYWVHAFSWDLACYVLTIFLCVIALILFKAEAYVNPRSLPGLIILLVLYGWANIPLMYPATFFFDIPSSAFVSLSCLNIFMGVTTTASTYVLKILNDEYLTAIEQILRDVFVFFPHFCLGEGIMKIAEAHITASTFAEYNINVETDLFSLQILGRNFLSLFFGGIVFFLIVLLYERFHKKGLWSEHLVGMSPPPLDDDDVLTERNRILNSEVNDLLVLKCLTKTFGKKKQIVVNQLCLGVKKGECFGLLGLNGAGKTTTFKMLTGDTTITFGDATVEGYSVRNEMASVGFLIGYCPQFDALDAKLTAKEHLELYSHLRNVPLHEVDLVVENCLKMFDLIRYQDVCTIYLSGGNRRKLSTAIAILGNTRLIFLDEPTSGMDPKGRRFLWSRIKGCVRNGRAVMLTSHSMAECEALCSRLTIMVNGQFKCLGSVQHLKNKFGEGYNLVVRTPLENMEVVKQQLVASMPCAVEQSTHCTQIKYDIPVDILSLSRVFGLLEQMSAQALILDYSISQKSLEEIFLHFVKQQSGEKSEIK